MNAIKFLVIAGIATALSGCEGGTGSKQDKTVDRGFGSNKHLSSLTAGIWIDPQGCDHWIIDDGVEGYLSARVDKYGKPVCSGVGEPGTAIGPYKDGASVADYL